MLRFALVTAAGLAVAAAVILFAVRQFEVRRLEGSANTNAAYATDAVLRHELRASDLTGVSAGARRFELDDIFSHRLSVGMVLRATLVAADGRVMYSTDHPLIGRRVVSPRIAEATAGKTISETINEAIADQQQKVLRTYVPIVLGQERVTGVVIFDNDYASIADQAKSVLLPVGGVLELVLLGLFIVLVPVLARASRRIDRHVSEIEHRATHDDLTGLPNRPRFADEIRERLAHDPNEPLAVLLVDLDRFKEINDTLGHGAGDELLQQAGQRLQAAMGQHDLVARLGGDEFGIVMWGDKHAARTVSSRASELLSRPFDIQGLQVSVEGSIGVALAPMHGTDVKELLQHADVAMYTAKARRSGTEVYDPASDTSDAARFALLAELRNGLHAGELVVFFQPQVAVPSGRFTGAEALVRWEHPTRGLLSPGAFLPAAEHTGLGKEINRFVLAEAVRRCTEWRMRGLKLDVSVNLTMIDLLDLGLPDAVAQVLDRHGLPPESLVLEITESIIMADERRVAEVLKRLVAMGVRIAIDDFGTGYSSIAYLRQLPLHEVKVDQSFVREALNSSDDREVVRWTIELAHSLGKKVVAEGVESTEQWQLLEALGCDVVQGYLVSRPIANDDLVELVGSSEPFEHSGTASIGAAA